MSPLIQKPFSETLKTKRIIVSIRGLYVLTLLQEKLQDTEMEKLQKNKNPSEGQPENIKVQIGRTVFWNQLATKERNELINSKYTVIRKATARDIYRDILVIARNVSTKSKDVRIAMSYFSNTVPFAS